MVLRASGYSATVTLDLRLNGRVLPLAQSSPEFITLREPVQLPGGRAEIIIRVDDSANQLPIEIAPMREPARRFPIGLLLRPHAPAGAE